MKFLKHQYLNLEFFFFNGRLVVTLGITDIQVYLTTESLCLNYYTLAYCFLNVNFRKNFNWKRSDWRSTRRSLDCVYEMDYRRGNRAGTRVRSCLWNPVCRCATRDAGKRTRRFSSGRRTRAIPCPEKRPFFTFRGRVLSALILQ